MDREPFSREAIGADQKERSRKWPFDVLRFHLARCQPRRPNRQDPLGVRSPQRWLDRACLRPVFLNLLLVEHLEEGGQRIGLTTVVDHGQRTARRHGHPQRQKQHRCAQDGHGLAVTDCHAQPLTRVGSGVASARAPVPGTGLPAVDCWVRGNSRRLPTSRGGPGGNRAGSAPQPAGCDRDRAPAADSRAAVGDTASSPASARCRSMSGPGRAGPASVAPGSLGPAARFSGGNPPFGAHGGRHRRSADLTSQEDQRLSHHLSCVCRIGYIVKNQKN